MPQGDEAFVLTADKLPGNTVLITLCSAVKARFLHQPVQHIISEGGVAAVFVGQLRHTACGVVCHLPGQAASGGAHRVSSGIILCGLPAAVRVEHDHQVARDAVLIAGFVALCIFLADQSAPVIVSTVLAEAFFLMKGSDLTEAVIFVTGLVA